MMLNPTVSVRSKGVMEKCNFCIQRTRDVREQEKSTGRKYDDKAPGAVTTACAQTCPTGAITFGDINDPASEVNAVAAASPHSYRLLDAELNTRPSVLYMQRVRNRPATSDEMHHGTAGEAHAAPAVGHDAPSPAAHGEGH
jgi:Fe-S-cluster-containing dehydrogenase component